MTPRKSAQEALKARAAAVAAGTSPVAAGTRKPVIADAHKAAPEPVAAPREPARTPRTKPVKMTIDLQPIEHRRLRQWCATTAADLDLPMIAASEVLRVLWQLTQDDPQLAARVRAELARTGGSRRR